MQLPTVVATSRAPFSIERARIQVWNWEVPWQNHENKAPNTVQALQQSVQGTMACAGGSTRKERNVLRRAQEAARENLKVKVCSYKTFLRKVSNDATLQRARCNGQARLPRPGDCLSCGPASPGPPWSGECVSQGRIDSCIGLWRRLSSARGSAETEALEITIDLRTRQRLC
jgi:hypothetical protein